MAGKEDRFDFQSKSFNPTEALSSTNIHVPVEDAEAFENLQLFRSAVHGRALHMEQDIPGVLGPGGLPLQRVAAVPVDRNFEPDQGPIRGRGPRRVRNVINRMEEMQGPLAVLRRCQQDNIKVKVYTRNQSEIRGILTGYVVAFDKHWNLALRDVDEIFQKKLQCKTPAFGNVSNFVSIGDLTIRERGRYFEPDSDDEEHEITGMLEQETSKGGATGFHLQGYVKGKEEGEEAGPSTTFPSSYSRKSLALGKGEEVVSKRKKMEFIGAYTLESLDQRARSSVPISKEHPLTSEAQDALRLSLSRRKQGLQVEVALQSEEEEMTEKKRIRKRKKREIRKRHVNQLFVRGENVVLINVLND